MGNRLHWDTWYMELHSQMPQYVTADKMNLILPFPEAVPMSLGYEASGMDLHTVKICTVIRHINNSDLFLEDEGTMWSKIKWTPPSFAKVQKQPLQWYGVASVQKSTFRVEDNRLYAAIKMTLFFQCFFSNCQWNTEPCTHYNGELRKKRIMGIWQAHLQSWLCRNCVLLHTWRCVWRKNGTK